MNLTADLDIYFADFGAAASYTPSGGQAAALKVIFDNAHQTLDMLGGGVGFESAGPQALCKTSDVSTAKHGDTIVVSSKTYYVTGVEPDGIGLTKLLLSEDISNV